MVGPPDALATRMTLWSVEIRYPSLVSLSDSHCSSTIGRSYYSFWIRAAVSLRTPVSPEWSCSAMVMGGCIGRQDGERTNVGTIPTHDFPCTDKE